jgi:hypothetical protein
MPPAYLVVNATRGPDGSVTIRSQPRGRPRLAWLTVMALTRSAGSYEEGAGGSRGPGGPPPHDDAQTSQMLAGAVGDRCANCGSTLASDQRYCLDCGQRRGKSRFSLASMSGPAAAAPTTVVSVPAEPLGRRGSSGATLIAGIATLILAMGVGVVIGHASNSGANTSTRAATPTVIVNGGGGSGAASTNASSLPQTHSTKQAKVSKSEKVRAKTAATATKPTQAAVQKASNAAQSVLGAKAKQAPTVTSGQSCQAGSAGCTNGRFTGTFFGQ